MFTTPSSALQPTLHPYMAWAGDDPAEGAALVFAPSARAARPLAFGVLTGWFDIAFTDVRIRRLRHHVDHLRSLADPDRLALGRAHVIEAPTACPRCECWGAPLSPNATHCAFCAEDSP